jgi:UDP-N-acetylmuramoyl-L-alanyl-D-glutamate--2,6-diaminopimelate ligase
MNMKRSTSLGAVLGAACGRKEFEFELIGEAETAITDVTHSTASVHPGALFVCVTGENVDGHELAQQAIDAGAVALLVERKLPLNTPQIVVANTRQTQGIIAAAFWGFPSDELLVVAVTGTNGKTTTAHLLGSILRQHGLRTEVMGTLSGSRTTAESTDLQRQLAQFVDRNVQAVVMEVTSHAMVLHRVEGTHFALAIFTNLTPEHLDFHGTMERYFAAKASLFTSSFTPLGIVNFDDVHGRLIADTHEIECIPFSVNDVQKITASASSHEFTWRTLQVRVNVGGKFNVSNSLAAVTAAVQLGVSETDIVAGLAAAETVPGRFEQVRSSKGFDVVVDYAHTPDALQRVLLAAREVVGTKHRVLVVFGCGGDRDSEKRPLMGAIAAKFADYVVVTSDNPRSESPSTIAQNIIDGIGAHGGNTIVKTEVDRRLAIQIALDSANSGDIVVIAGKGHEKNQTIGNDVLPFDDVATVREILGVVA